ncbi:hypothetical protein ACFQ08_22745 [Streptosporangium algeriense]|uniref:MmyB-like transcription regulator ligand binding domain-containing protein n=1 Tax=Streptosporangium algeriense TaxID=1682748 RepID=A0ABW3DWA2_9ACTN
MSAWRVSSAAIHAQRPLPHLVGCPGVYVHRHGTKRFRHPAIGDLDLDYEAFELPGDQALTLLTYSAEPGTPSGDGLQLLAAWAARNQSPSQLQNDHQAQS